METKSPSVILYVVAERESSKELIAIISTLADWVNLKSVGAIESGKEL